MTELNDRIQSHLLLYGVARGIDFTLPVTVVCQRESRSAPVIVKLTAHLRSGIPVVSEIDDPTLTVLLRDAFRRQGANCRSLTVKMHIADHDRKFQLAATHFDRVGSTFPFPLTAVPAPGDFGSLEIRGFLQTRFAGTSTARDALSRIVGKESSLLEAASQGVENSSERSSRQQQIGDAITYARSILESGGPPEFDDHALATVLRAMGCTASARFVRDDGGEDHPAGVRITELPVGPFGQALLSILAPVIEDGAFTLGRGRQLRKATVRSGALSFARPR